MTDPTRPALGLSVGATRLAAVTPACSVTRAPVVTLYRHRPPEFGPAPESPANPNLDEAGVVLTDFVDRAGDPVGIVAADGSTHSAEALLAQALRALAYAATAGHPLPGSATVSHPAHWRPAAVEALRGALRRVPEWSATALLLIADTVASLTALQTDPGLPTRGVVALCDFGGSGTSFTLVDAASGYQPIGPTVRYQDFSGDLVDQALLAHVMAELSTGAALDVTGTSAIGSLTRLRAQCRAAKERLSAAAVTALPAELPGFRGDVRLTRTELDDAIGPSLAGAIDMLQDTMVRVGVRPSDLVAVASVGGGAGLPAITTMLSEHLRVPVVTRPRPGLAAAIGAALRAARGPGDDRATVLAPAAVTATTVAPAPVAEPAPVNGAALAWSEAAEVPDLPPMVGDHPDPPADRGGLTGVRPRLDFEADPGELTETPLPWYRRPMPVVAAALLVIAGAGAGTAVALRSDNDTGPVAPTPSITTSPVAAPPGQDGASLSTVAPVPASVPVLNQAVEGSQAAEVQGPTRTVVQVPPPVTQTRVVEAPPVTTEAPPPPPVTETSTATVTTTAVSTPPPVTETATVVPPSATQPPALIPTIPPIPTIPGLPQFLQPSTSG